MKQLLIITGIVFCIFFQRTQGQAQNGITLNVQIAPPDLPEYDQPVCPGDGYLWSPGYWAYGDDGYYWVPGVWVYPPTVGYLWTPSYWAFSDGYYNYHAGYWGEHVGFYGGINYGYGYGGNGFHGGRWEGRSFHYNTAVMNVNREVIHNTYNEHYDNNRNNRSSFNGNGGVNARPSKQERRTLNDHRMNPTPEQTNHHLNAAQNQKKLEMVNHTFPSPRPVRNMADPRINHAGQGNKNEEKPSMSATPVHQNAPARRDAKPRANKPKHEKKN